ncbi:MAG: tRNA (adenosine(37)-N6)-threonylcarbamoyltransferase complex dimerization subunit type 1 TsaB [Pseudomonadota bacterium]
MTEVTLALETSTTMCAVGVSVDGQIHVDEIDEPRAHASQIMGQLERVLRSAAIELSAVTRVAFGRGPGSFTGVRIAVALAQGLAAGIDVPVLGVSSLRIMAQQAAGLSRQPAPLLIAQDARLREVYAGRYALGEDGVVTALRSDTLLAPEQIVIDDGDTLVGDAWQAMAALAARASDHAGVVLGAVSPNAGSLLQIAAATPPDQWCGAEEASAVYLRNQVAHRSG